MKKPGFGFAVLYLHSGLMHDYMPDFIVRLKTDAVIHGVSETKGYDPPEGLKRAAAERWVAAVSTYGQWRDALVKKVSDIDDALAGTVVASSGLSEVRYAFAPHLLSKVAEEHAKYGDK